MERDGETACLTCATPWRRFHAEEEVRAWGTEHEGHRVAVIDRGALRVIRSAVGAW